MEGFVAKKPSILTRLGSSVAFYAIFIGIVVAGAIFLYLTDDHQVSDREAIYSPPEAVRIAEETEPSPEEAIPEEPAPPPPPVERVAEPRARMQVPPRVAEPPGTAASREPTQVSVEFFLANREIIERFTSVGEGQLEIGRFSMATVAQYSGRHGIFSKDPGFESLAQDTRPMNFGQSTITFRGGKEPKSNEAIGFFVDITPVRHLDRNIEYRVSIKRSLPELIPTGEVKVVSQTSDWTVILPPRAALVLGGLLPRKPLFEGEADLYRGNILKALTDPGFQNGDQEFILAIHPH